MSTKEGFFGRANVALALLVLINLFNYIDRQVLAAVESQIEETMFQEADYPRDPETRQRVDTTITSKMGSLVMAFMISYMLFSPIFGLLADRFSRWMLVGVGVIVWSLASGASGLADSFTMLFLTRCLVGVGEAAYGPVAPTVISDLFPVQRRGLVMALFYMAIPVGSALGYVLGGQVSHFMNDWRWAFYVVVPPGLLLGAWCFLMRDPPRGASDPGAIMRQAKWADYMVMLRTRSYLFVTLGMTAMTFALGGIGFFMPRFARARIIGTSVVSAEESAKILADVNTTFGIIVVVSGLGATILGGIVGDKLKPKIPGAYFIVSAIAMATAFPLLLCAIWAPYPLAWLFIFLSCFCLFFNTGPTNTILANVTHPSIRASAFALNILIIHAFGDAVSPTIIGLINGYFGDPTMTAGFVAVSVMCLVASVFWFFGAKHLQSDTELAPMRIAGEDGTETIKPQAPP